MALNRIALTMLESKVLTLAEKTGTGALKLSYSDGTSFVYNPGSGGGISLPIPISGLMPSLTEKLVSNGTEIWLGGPSNVQGHGLVFDRTNSAIGVPLIVSSVNGPNTEPGAYFVGKTGLGAYGVPTGTTQLSTAPGWKNAALLGLSPKNNLPNGAAGYFLTHRGVGVRVDWVDLADSSTPQTASTPSMTVDICGPNYGIQLYGSQIAAFTGAHDALFRKSDRVPVPGDILVDDQVIYRANINDCITSVKASSKPNQQNVIGVFVRVCSDDHIPSALARFQEDAVGRREIQLVEAFTNIKKTFLFVAVNALGEGLINVCGENGNFEAGDLITTSSTEGKGMRQSDDILRASTVAKIRESVEFETPEEVRQVACIYVSG